MLYPSTTPQQASAGPGQRGSTLPWTLALTLLGVIFLATRLMALLALPLFNDEAVYLVRAQSFPAMLVTSGVAGSTLPDGKLIHELALAALAMLPGDPVVSGRLLSVVCGLGVVLTLCAIGRGLGRPRAGLLAGLLYALAPLAQIHEVLALPDVMLTLVSALLLWACLRFGLAATVGRREAAAIGALLAVACMVKLTGLFLFAVPVLAALLLQPERAEVRRRLGLLRVSLIVALAALAALAPFHYGAAEGHKVINGSRIDIIGRNLLTVSAWGLRYLPGALLLPPLALLLDAFRRWRAGRGTGAGAPGVAQAQTTSSPRLVLFLLGAGLSLAAIFVVVGQTLYSRYLLPGWPALALAAAVAGEELWARGGVRRGLAAACLGGAMLWGALFQGWLIVAPLSAPLATGDRFQYVEAWSAGQGLDRLRAELQAAALAQPGLTVVTGVEIRLANLTPWLALGDDAGVRLTQVDLWQEDAPARVAALAGGGPLLVVVDAATDRAYHLAARFPDLREVRRYTHASGDAGFVIYEALPGGTFFVPE